MEVVVEGVSPPPGGDLSQALFELRQSPPGAKVSVVKPRSTLIVSRTPQGFEVAAIARACGRKYLLAVASGGTLLEALDEAGRKLAVASAYLAKVMLAAPKAEPVVGGGAERVAVPYDVVAGVDVALADAARSLRAAAAEAYNAVAAARAAAAGAEG